jgi:hypothetical protein
VAEDAVDRPSQTARALHFVAVAALKNRPSPLAIQSVSDWSSAIGTPGRETVCLAEQTHPVCSI